MPRRKKLTRGMLLNAAGRTYFGRGEDYFESGCVQSIRERNGVVRATVLGTEPYKTKLTPSDMEGTCSCPLGQEGEFCKHLVATGLEYIENSTKKKSKPLTPKDIEAYLSKQKKAELVRIIMEQTDIDDEFYAMLKLRVVAETASSNTTEMRRVLRQAMTISDFVSWDETSTYTSGIDRVLEQFRTMLTPKQAAQVVELAEYGMDLWEENIELIDDSNGCMGMIRDDLHQLHLEACTVAEPEPTALAERLARRAIDSEWDMFYGAYESYHDIFGEAGRARFRQIVEEQWNALPKIQPGEEDSGRNVRIHTLEHMMLSIAEGGNDPDLAIRVLGRDLSSAYRYLRIAQCCREARRYKQAMEWAEKGMKAFADNPDPRLRSFLADEYLRAKRPDDAIAMIWANFTGRTTLENYRELAKYARKLKQWNTLRDKAFAHIRDDLKERRSRFVRSSGRDTTYRRWAPRPPDHSLLVEILLWEKNEDQAWVEAQKGGCTDHLWLDLAKRREKKHPGDAVEIYRRQVVPLVDQTNNKSYKKAVDFIRRIYNLMKTSGEEKEFHTWLAQLKAEYKRKRNFIKYVERTSFGKTVQK